MSNIVKINNEDLSIREINGQRVITFKDIDILHKRVEGTARKRFNDNKERLRENEDYFVLKPNDVSDVRKTDIQNITLEDVNNRGTTFITESGYLMIVKSLTDDLAWEVQRKLVNTYFRHKQILPNNEFDVMRMCIDQLEAVKYGVDKAIQTSNQALNKVAELEEKVDVVIKNDYVKANDIARQLKLFTESKLPHSQLIGQIARKLGYKTDFKRHYQDEYIAITGDSGVYDVYYKPKAIEEIADWFKKNKNKCYYEIFYKRDTKNNSKGDVREKGYKINGTHFKTT